KAQMSAADVQMRDAKDRKVFHHPDRHYPQASALGHAIIEFKTTTTTSAPPLPADPPVTLLATTFKTRDDLCRYFREMLRSKQIEEKLTVQEAAMAFALMRMRQDQGKVFEKVGSGIKEFFIGYSLRKAAVSQQQQPITTTQTTTTEERKVRCF